LFSLNPLFSLNIESWFRLPDGVTPATVDVDQELLRRLDLTQELDFSAIEFWPYQNKNMPLLSRELESRKMTVTQFTAWGFGKELNDPAQGADNFIEAIKHRCEVADQLPGCDLFTVVAGDVIAGLTQDQMLDAVADKLTQAVPLLEAANKTIIVEPMNPYNHPDHCLYGSADGIALCKKVGSPRVKLNWDLFHMQRSEGNLLHNLVAGSDFVGYLQIADSPGRNEPGTGEVNWASIMGVLPQIGYDRPIGLELWPQSGNLTQAAAAVHALATYDKSR